MTYTIYVRKLLSNIDCYETKDILEATTLEDANKVAFDIINSDMDISLMASVVDEDDEPIADYTWNGRSVAVHYF